MSDFAKLKISGVVRVETGLHIGGSGAFSSIGSVDSPVVRDPLSHEPIIPGSSLKGKMRTLLARSRSNSIKLPRANGDQEEILRLFGSSAKGAEGRLVPSRLKFADCFLTDDSRELLKKRMMQPTEVKFENTINRDTAVANPRQIERVIRGMEFGLDIIYDVDDTKQLQDDFEVIGEGIRLLVNDYLGGHGTRGSGRVSMENISITCVYAADGVTDQQNLLNLAQAGYEAGRKG